MIEGWPNPEWVQATAPLVGVEPEDFNGTVEVVVKGAVPAGASGEAADASAAAKSPRGRGRRRAEPELHYHRVFAAGRVVDSTMGAVDTPDVSFTVTEDDARAMLSGELEPSVAFMRGTLKTSGDPGMVLRLLGAWSTEAARQARVTMGEQAGPLV